MHTECVAGKPRIDINGNIAIQHITDTLLNTLLSTKQRNIYLYLEGATVDEKVCESEQEQGRGGQRLRVRARVPDANTTHKYEWVWGASIRVQVQRMCEDTRGSKDE